MKTTTAEQDPKAATKLREMIEDIAVAMLITVTSQGSLRSRPMLTQEVREDGELWFFTSDESDIAEDLAEERAVNVSYADTGRDRYVSVVGQGRLVKERNVLEEHWDDSFSRLFPRGLEDPHLALLRVDIETAEYWDGQSSRMMPLKHPLSDRSTDGATAPNLRSNSHEKRSVEEETDHTKVEIRATPASG